MQRDYSIDILKFFACLIITWSHFEKPLGEYSILATGGTFGDILFFFCSGYTIFLSKECDFFNYYKRRINRIYPTVFAWALLTCLFWGSKSDFIQIIRFGGGWFVSCIMVYYIILWFLRKFVFNYIRYVIPTTIIFMVIVYFVWGTGTANGSMYGYSVFRWIPYFMYMLLGALYGIQYKNRQNNIDKVAKSYSIVSSVLMLGLCVVLYYVFFSFCKRTDILNSIQLLSVFPLFGVCIYFYRICNTEIMLKVYNSKIGNKLIRFIGGLCLEIYLVQGKFLTDEMNDIFPLNIVIIILEIVLFAYILRCIARFWSQTFKDGNYDWKEIIKMI